MIVGKLKPIEEIATSIAGFKEVFVVGCGSCVTVCLSGGDREAQSLVRELANDRWYDGDPPAFMVETFKRQCDSDLVRAYLKVPAGTDAILSLACGAGVQTLADTFGNLPLIPAMNTSFLGALDDSGMWREKCQGCGDCVLTYTAGICPIARCAKRLFNGPCGGSSKGECEIGGGVECAWQLIVDRLEALGRIEEYQKIQAVKDWSSDRGGGPRFARGSANNPFD